MGIVGPPKGGGWDPGNFCNHCVPELWQPYMTPKFMTVQVINTEACNDPPYGAPPEWVVCEQDPVDNCRWNYVDANWNYRLYMFGNTVSLDLRYTDTSKAFLGGGPNCALSFSSNLQTCGAGNERIKGTCNVFLGDVAP